MINDVPGETQLFSNPGHYGANPLLLPREEDGEHRPFSEEPWLALTLSLLRATSREGRGKARQKADGQLSAVPGTAWLSACHCEPSRTSSLAERTSWASMRSGISRCWSLPPAARLLPFLSLPASGVVQSRAV